MNPALSAPGPRWPPRQTSACGRPGAGPVRGLRPAGRAAEAAPRHGLPDHRRPAGAVRFGGAASLGIEGVDLLVDSQLSAELGLVHRVAALISAPGIGLTRLITEVGRSGQSGKIVSLRQQQLPVTKAGPAADHVPAAVPGLGGEVLPRPVLDGAGRDRPDRERGRDQRRPVQAGALGPMQFEPSTWAVWGIDGFGQTGPPDIMNPYDAVPSAARMLCADGAAAGGAALSAAIFDYNHANWYVSEVLSLAAEYAQELLLTRPPALLPPLAFPAWLGT